VVRCAFCPEPAECNLGATNVPPPCCGAHRPLSKAVYREVDALRGGKQLAWQGAWHRAVWSLAWGDHSPWESHRLDRIL